MKKINKTKILKLFLLILTCFIATSVIAESAPSSLKMTYYSKKSTPISFPATFHVKKTTSGKYVYCAHYAKKPPVKSVSYKRGSLIKDNGMNYILSKAYDDVKDDNSFFIYQNALWIYMIDKGKMPKPYSTLTQFKNTVNKGNSSTAKKIRTLVSNAKKASANDTSNPTISASQEGVTFNLDSNDTYYVSTPITVKSSTNAYTVEITSAPSGTTYSIDGDKLYVKIPVSSVTGLSASVQLKVKNSKSIYRSYYYNPSSNAYQSMVATYKDNVSSEAIVNLSLTRTTSIDILKVDESGNALAGATLEVTNSQGTSIDKWTTDTSKHTVSGLSEGEYTLKETEAPVGYKKSGEEIKFSIDANGNVKDSAGNTIKLITYTNDKMSITVSKQDITNSEEVPGASLVIKDESGKEIISWTSSSKPYVIKGLKAGTYTLTETMAPEGYTKSEESITFKMDESGNVFDAEGNAIDKVIMYNKKTTTPGGASISKKDATTGNELPGASLVVKDYDGNVIDEWVSTDKPHVIENLKAGIYTLSETIAPDGYIKSTETVTFTVKDDGSVTPVVMYNSRNTKDTGTEVPVESTGSYKNMISMIIGIITILVGGILLFITMKKKENN